MRSNSLRERLKIRYVRYSMHTWIKVMNILFFRIRKKKLLKVVMATLRVAIKSSSDKDSNVKSKVYIFSFFMNASIKCTWHEFTSAFRTSKISVGVLKTENLLWIGVNVREVCALDCIKCWQTFGERKTVSSCLSNRRRGTIDDR